MKRHGPLSRKSPLRARATLDRSSELFRSTAPKRTNGFAASPEQREKVKGRVCLNCAGGPPCDPAHLTSRGAGGCTHPDCVVPLCRVCHREFDEGRLDLESVIALPDHAVERAHMALHGSFALCIKRLRGMAA